MTMAHAAFATLAVLLAAVAYVDARSMIIPDPLNAAIAVLGLGASYATGLPDPASALAGVLAGGLLLGLVRLQFRFRRGFDGLGLGDVKLAAASGAWTGIEDLAPSLFFGSVCCLLYVAAKRVAGSPVGATQKTPFGPFLGLGAGAVAAWHAVAGSSVTETMAGLLSGR